MSRLSKRNISPLHRLSLKEVTISAAFAGAENAILASPGESEQCAGRRRRLIGTRSRNVQDAHARPIWFSRRQTLSRGGQRHAEMWEPRARHHAQVLGHRRARYSCLCRVSAFILRKGAVNLTMNHQVSRSLRSKIRQGDPCMASGSTGGLRTFPTSLHARADAFSDSMLPTRRYVPRPHVLAHLTLGRRRQVADTTTSDTMRRHASVVHSQLSSSRKLSTCSASFACLVQVSLLRFLP